MKDTGERRLRIGSTESNAAVRLAPVLVKLHASNPKLKLELFTAPTKFIMEKTAGLSAGYCIYKRSSVKQGDKSA